MKIGFMGLGKLGLPCALAIESKGHDVCGYDVDPNVIQYIEKKRIPYKEEGVEELLEKTKIEVLPIKEVVKRSDIIFVAIQTPHDKKYEGTTRLPYVRVDFNYEYLKSGVLSLMKEIDRQGQDVVVVIISTVLPGTIHREILPHQRNGNMLLVYNPFFIAMGTTIYDFLNPEIILLGISDEEAKDIIVEFYLTIMEKIPIFKTMSVESAELTKVAYNTIITSKINIANTIMEISHKTPFADCDEVIDALKDCTDRIVSPRYMDAGMGDGGGCHPRDNIALSWLAKKLNLSHDIYEDLMKTREDQTEWLADLIIKESTRLESTPDRDIVILGYSFKPETNIETGSPAILLLHLLVEKGHRPAQMFDPYVYDPSKARVDGPKVIQKYVEENAHIYFIGTKHKCFRDYTFAKGSVVIDPFRYINYSRGLENEYKVIHVGYGQS